MASRPPNIVYVIAHDLGRTLGCYGEAVLTPQLDRFAAEGVRFDRAFCAAPACSPARGCAYTGQYSHTNGLMGLVNGGWSLPIESKTFVDYLNGAGYHTVVSGLDHTRARREDMRFKQYLTHAPRTAGAVDDAIGFLDTYEGDAPFLLNVGTVEVHSSQWLSQHPPANRFGPGASLRDYGRAPDPGKAFLPACMPDFPLVRAEMANMQACVEYFDFHIGRLLNAIDRLSYRENTVVMVTTDHGIDGMRAKTSVYDKGTEITCLVRGPGIASGAVMGELVENIDYLPTFLELAGAEIPDSIQGRSLLPLLSGESAAWREMIFTERNYHGGNVEPRPDGASSNYDPIRSVRTQDLHLIRNFQPGKWLPTPPDVRDVKPLGAWLPSMLPVPDQPRPELELYDLRTDPNEWHNVAEDPAYTSECERLLAALDQWMRDTDDPLLQGPIPDRLHGW